MAQTVPILWLDGESDVVPQEERELTILAHEVMRSLNATGVAIAIEDGEHIICRARAGTSAPELGTFLDRNAGISGRCIREDAALAVYDTELDDRVNRDVCRTLGIRSLAVAPVHQASRIIGIVEVFSSLPNSFEVKSLRQLETYAAQASAIWDRELPAAKDFECEHPGVEVASEKPTRPPEFISNLNRETKSSHWRWTLAVASLVPVILIGFSYRGAMRSSLVRANGKIFSSSVMPGSKPAVPSVSPENSSSAALEELAPTSASVAPSTVPSDKVDDFSVRSKEMRERAGSGEPEAQLILASHYAKDGPDRDLVKAAAWYIVAGITGNSQARQTATELTGKLSPFQIAQIRFRVAEMFRDGIGVPPDLETAYSWFILAQAAGDVHAQVEEKKLGMVMRPDEILDARNRAASWIAAHRRKILH